GLLTTLLALGLPLRRLGRLLGPRRTVAARRLDLDRLALLADHRDRRPDRHLTFWHRDLQQHPREIGLDLLGDLVGVQLVERLALLDRVPLLLEPLDDGA